MIIAGDNELLSLTSSSSSESSSNLLILVSYWKKIISHAYCVSTLQVTRKNLYSEIEARGMMGPAAGKWKGSCNIT